MGYIRIALRKRESILSHSLQSRKYFTCTIMFHFVRLLKFLPAAYFINDFLSRVDKMTRIRLRHDIDRNKRHYQIVILVNNQGIANPPVSRWLGK